MHEGPTTRHSVSHSDKAEPHPHLLLRASPFGKTVVTENCHQLGPGCHTACYVNIWGHLDRQTLITLPECVDDTHRR
ncbi:hypothetical protein CGRA01v4_04795 [Colletotrichum graminicola]|nr:hypothetical protein CGRA01v4_04795 [Colletotrichum graminicola]